MEEDQPSLPPQDVLRAANEKSPDDNAASAAPSAEAITPEILKSAYNAFKKRWKLTRLDQESRIGRGPMSGGQKSSIDGIIPPNQFPNAVWEALAEKGRIKYTGSGFYAMP